MRCSPARSRYERGGMRLLLGLETREARVLSSSRCRHAVLVLLEILVLASRHLLLERLDWVQQAARRLRMSVHL